jgi:serine protease
VVLLEPDNASLAPPTSPIDVFEVVQRLWTRARRDKWTLGFQVGLEHLLSVSIGLAPFGASLSPFGASLSPFGASLQSAGIPLNRSAAGGILSYLNPGTGGRAPVSLVLNLPDDKASGPRVVVLDTGCDATHVWFSDDHIVRRVAVVDDAGTVVKSGDGVHDLTIGIDVDVPANQETDPEGAACAPDEMTGAVKPCVGHGTFIAGVLRQKAPSAQIVALRIADADGIVPEGALTAAISELIVRQGQELTKSSGTTGWADALVLSLGYYPEMDGATEADILEHSALGAQLPHLAELGVAIFAAAGNDATTREFFPGAFAVDPPFLNAAAGALSRIPLVSVAAQNPDGTIALFSNDGSWVTAQALGANVVSTFPRFMCGAWQPDVSLRGPAGRVRATIDPDQYSGGFGVWSGTSFAAPVLAGDYLTDLARQVARQGQSQLDERRDLIRALVRPEHRSPERPVAELMADDPDHHGPS